MAHFNQHFCQWLTNSHPEHLAWCHQALDCGKLPVELQQLYHAHCQMTWFAVDASILLHEGVQRSVAQDREIFQWVERSHLQTGFFAEYYNQVKKHNLLACSFESNNPLKVATYQCCDKILVVNKSYKKRLSKMHQNLYIHCCSTAQCWSIVPWPVSRHAFSETPQVYSSGASWFYWGWLMVTAESFHHQLNHDSLNHMHYTLW